METANLLFLNVLLFFLFDALYIIILQISHSILQFSHNSKLNSSLCLFVFLIFEIAIYRLISVRTNFT